MSQFPARGLYAITREAYSGTAALVEAVAAAIRGGAGAIQYRAKNSHDREGEARSLRRLCRSKGVPFLINDDVELALRVGADGVHVGKTDMGLPGARQRLGAEAIIGVSCYDSMALALDAERQGASYVAFGRFFPSRTKPHAPCARLETLMEAKQRLNLPVVAIGGITAHNGSALLAAGATHLAVIEGVFGGPDPEFAASEFRGCFGSGG